MATFSEIVAQSEKDRHKVYFLGIPHKDEKGFIKYELIGAPKPKAKKKVSLKQLQDIERRQRAAKMAELYDGSEVELDTLLPHPEHSPGGLNGIIGLLKRIQE